MGVLAGHVGADILWEEHELVERTLHLHGQTAELGGGYGCGYYYYYYYVLLQKMRELELYYNNIILIMVVDPIGWSISTFLAIKA